MELIFEIGCEELPSRFVEPALDQIRTAFSEACSEQRIAVGEVELLATPRRLTLLASGLADTQRDLEEERTGPPANITFDDDGNPSRAAQGFARGQGVDPGDLYTVETDKGEYVAAKVFEKGAPTKELLPQILTDILESLHFPKSMRWGSEKTNFGRPIRWLLAIADGDVIPVEFAGVTSSNTTCGHRFAAPDPFEVDSIEAYRTGLKEASVMVDQNERRAFVEAALNEHAEETGGRLVDDPELIDEVVYLVEKPHAVTLEFNEEYLELPREILITSMRSHQRYFAVEETDGSALKNACVVIYNTPVHDPEVVAEGNLKVLRARLDDARFFWDKDLQIPLMEHRDKLKDVIWIGPLGTMFDRTVRISQTAGMIADEDGLDPLAKEQAEIGGELTKADLVTQVVNEFPDLQGIIGHAYALKARQEAKIAIAIEEQYLPRSADGDLPQTEAGSCVAIAEKLDAIVGCFGVGMVPTSASDPYGLRRAAVGILRILEDRNSTIPLPTLVLLAISSYATDVGETPFEDDDAVADGVTDFLVTRLRYLLDGHAPTDVINSVLAAGVADVPSVHGRIKALAALRDQADFEPLALGFKRVVNILEKQAQNLDLDSLDVDTSLFEDPSEENLFKAYETAREAVSDHLRKLEWDAACQSLIELKEPVDLFFDNVMVMADDEALRTNRIALLAKLRDLFFEVADISKIQT